MIDYAKLDREFAEHCEREPNIDDEIEAMLPLFAAETHLSMKNEVLENCATRLHNVFRKAPLSVLKKLFMECVQHSPMIAGTLRVLRHEHKAVDYRLGEFSAYVGLFRWLLNQPEVDLSQEEIYSGFCHLVANITKCHDDRVQKVELEVAKATELVGLFVIPLLFNDSEHKRLISLDIMNRIFSTGDTNAKRARIAWTNEEKPESVNPGMLAYAFLSMLQSGHAKHNVKYRNQLIAALESLGAPDKFRIPDRYTNLLRSKLNESEWMVTYAFVKWFKESLSVSLRPEIPIAVVNLLGKDATDKFFKLHKSSIGIPDEIIDAMVALFDLSFFYPQLANEFLNAEKTLNINCYIDHLGIRISKAFVVSVDKFLQDYSSTDSLLFVEEPLEWIVSLVDPPRDYRHIYPTPTNFTMYNALRALEPLFIVLDAACDSLSEAYTPRSPKTREVLFNFAAEYLEKLVRKQIEEVETCALQISPPPEFTELVDLDPYVNLTLAFRWEVPKTSAWTALHAVSNYIRCICPLLSYDTRAKGGIKRMTSFLEKTFNEFDKLIVKTEEARKNAAREKEESRKHRTFYGYAQPRH
uniref:Negative elongation factor D n=1 Tax=Steinernema glaseri TaxID=37863 RepID=A0A1I7XYF2_9BILA